MNTVSLIGRLTKDPELKHHGQTDYCRFAIAIDRGKDRDGKDRGADFPMITVFGRTAENLARYQRKGKVVAVSGRIQTGSYDKNGERVYTTEIIADRVEFLSPKDEREPSVDSAFPEYAQYDEDPFL